MPDNFDGGGLPEILQNLMKSPEIGNILSSMKSEKQEASVPSPDGGFSLPPDLMEKLPSVISALSGIGLGSTPAFSPPKNSGGQQRKALLKALRPYLSPKRQTVVDSLIGLDGLTGLFSAVSGIGKEDA